VLFYWGNFDYVVLFCVFFYILSLGCSAYVVSTSVNDRLEKLVSEMTYNVLMGTFDRSHSPNITGSEDDDAVWCGV